ncbi:MAG: LpxI family protein [Bradyrhizobiaceae bacterium]|nr:MAG: LpxI family protein [Bradyrhizobiaceae bacterium]
MTDPADVRSPVALIAGSGVLPFALADSLQARGIEPFFIALKGFCDPQRVAKYRHRWVAVGQFGAVFTALKSAGCREVALIGGLIRPSVKDLRLDWGGLRLVSAFLVARRGGDDRLLGATAGFFEKEGFRVVGIQELAPELLMPEGNLTRAKPDDAARADIQKASALLEALSPFDVGQAAVVIDGHVVATEDIEGTDGLLARVRRLRESGRIRYQSGRGVLVKAPKKGQDLRFDLPALGPRTIAGVIDAGLAGIAVVAGHSVVAEPQEMVAAADSAGIFVVGLPA